MRPLICARPPVILSSFDQAGFHWILFDITQDALVFPGVSNPEVVALGLPEKGSPVRLRTRFACLAVKPFSDFKNSLGSVRGVTNKCTWLAMTT